jgi:uncharacterized protein
MPMDSIYTRILQKFAEKVRLKYPEAYILAFGSRARNNASIDSDFDICVILQNVDPEDRLLISDIAWEVGFEEDIMISTIVIPQKEYENGPLSASPLVDAIRSEGVAA